MTPTKPRYRLAVDAALESGASITLTGNAAHYLGHVLRLGAGDVVALFNRTQGEWRANIAAVGKRDITLQCDACLRPPARGNFHLTVCFTPIKGGRLETIIEKATELGASVLQPVLTTRSIVDKVNLERADAIAREAAEQCERIDWPVMRPPVKLPALLADWPVDLPLLYGDESGESESIAEAISKQLIKPCVAEGEPRSGGVSAESAKGQRAPSINTKNWAILTGPEGGFTPEEFALLKRTKSATGVGLGPRILRADTAVITLCVATLMAWGDWENAPRFGA